MDSVIVFHPSNELYGADRILVNALAALPEEVKKVIYIPEYGELSDFLLKNVKNSEITIERYPIIHRALFNPMGIFVFIFLWIKFLFNARKVFKKHKPDIIYCNTLATSFLLIIAKIYKIKSIIHVHEIIENPKLIKLLTSYLCSYFANKVIVVSNEVKSNLLEFSPRLEKKTFLLYNGIEGIDGEKSNVNDVIQCYLFARIMPNKGQWLVLDALSRLTVNEIKKLRVIIVGDTLKGRDYLLQDLKSKAKGCNLDSIIDFIGFQKNISILMSRADICLVPSTMKDPFPTTVLEAMSASKLVIASDGGGAKEAIKHKVTGILFETNNPDSLADQFRWVIKNKKRIKEIGLQAKEQFSQEFTINKFRKNFIQIFN